MLYKIKSLGTSILYLCVQPILQLIITLIVGSVAISGSTLSQTAKTAKVDLILESSKYLISSSTLILVLTIFVVWLIIKKNNPLEICGFGQASIKSVFHALLLGISLGAIFSAIVFIASEAKVVLEYRIFVQEMSKGNIIIPLIMAVIIAPLFDEFVFRGMILGELKKSFSFPAAVLAQAILYGMYQDSMLQAALYFILGIVFASIYNWTNSLLPGMLMNSAFRAISILLAANANHLNWLAYSVILLAGLVLASYMLYHLHSGSEDVPFEIEDVQNPDLALSPPDSISQDHETIT